MKLDLTDLMVIMIMDMVTLMDIMIMMGIIDVITVIKIIAIISIRIITIKTLEIAIKIPIVQMIVTTEHMRNSSGSIISIIIRKIMQIPEAAARTAIEVIHTTGSTSHVSDYEKALKFYGLKVPFTEKELKEKRRKMMKTAHPDAGGSTNEAETINQYYDILKKYAN